MFFAVQNVSAQISTEETIKAAKAGDAKAQNKLAIMYYHGQGVEQNFEQTIFWLKEAAYQKKCKGSVSSWTVELSRESRA